jgi:hypothetical protein
VGPAVAEVPAEGVPVAALVGLVPADGVAVGLVEPLGPVEGTALVGASVVLPLLDVVGLGEAEGDGEPLAPVDGVAVGPLPGVDAPVPEAADEPDPSTLRDRVVAPRSPDREAPDASSNPVMPAAASRKTTSAPARTRRGRGTACRTLDTLSRVRRSDAV